MAKDITIKNPQGTITYYPKTVSQLVYDNETDETVKEQIDAVNKKVRLVALNQLDTLKTVDSLGKYTVYYSSENSKIGSLEVYSEPTATYIIQVLNSNIKKSGDGGFEFDTPNAKNYILTRHYTLSTNTWSEWKNDLEVNVKSADVSYDSSTNYIDSSTVQGAIDELASEFEFGNKDVSVGYKYPATTSSYNPVADSRYCLSPYIPCKNGDTVVFSGGYEGTDLGMPLFGSSYQGVYHYTYNAEPKTQVIGRANAAYVRLSFLKDSENAYVEVNGVRKFEWSGRTYKKFDLMTMDDAIGDLNKLNTEAKDSLVNAVNEVNDIATPVYDTLLYKKYLVSPCLTGYWEAANVVVGNYFNAATYKYGNSKSSNTRRIKVPVKEGEKIYIDHLYFTVSTGPSWIFVNNETIVLSKATATSYTNLVLEAPAGATMLYIQHDISNSTAPTMYKYIIAQDKDDTDADWETLPKKSTRTGSNWTLTQPVGEKFTPTYSGSLMYGMWYKVYPKDKIKLTLQVLSGSTYSYYILGRDYRIMVAGEVPTDRILVDELIDVPVGAECIVFNTYPGSHLVKVNRKYENDVNDDYITKDTVLMGLNENKNDVAGERARTIKKRLTLAWCSDTHDDRDNYRRFIDYVNGHQGIVDAVLHTGDMNRMSDTDYGFNYTVLKYRSVQPFLPVMGNHDSHGGATASSEMLVSGSQTWQANKYVVPFMDSSCVRGTDDCYFYRDFDSFKIRVICLNDYDMPRYVNRPNWATTTDPDEIASAVDWQTKSTYNTGEVINYKGLYLKAKVDGTTIDNTGDRYSMNDNGPWSRFSCVGRYLQQAQVDFLINALLDTKLTADWGVIIATHQPLDAPVNANIVDTNWTDRTHEWIIPQFCQNGYILQDIIQAFMDHGTINQTYKGIKPETNPLSNNITLLNSPLVPDVTVNTDFINVTAHMICTMHGHTHQHGVYTSSRISGHRLLELVMETSCYEPDSIAIPNGFLTKLCVSDVIRGGNSSRECFNIISFDTTNKYIYLMRVGADTTDIFTKRDYSRISYADTV